MSFFHRWTALGLGLAFLLGPTMVAAEEPVRSPAWMAHGLRTAINDLWIPEIEAVGETPEPIDNGDRWAWAGDNAKLLSVLARTELIHGREAFEMRSFIEDMTHGPILFQRWANTYEPLIVADDARQAEVSNHLLTLRA